MRLGRSTGVRARAPPCPAAPPGRLGQDAAHGRREVYYCLLPMPPFHLASFIAFGVLKTISLAAHFLGNRPDGSPVVLAPARFLPFSLCFELGLLLAWCLGWAIVEQTAGRRRGGLLVARSLFLALTVMHLALEELDQQVVRWLGGHVNWSFLHTYATFGTGDLMGKILGQDWRSIGVSALLCAGAGIAAIGLWRLSSKGHALRLHLALPGIAVAAGLVYVPFGVNWSPKRWRRIQPAIVGMAGDGLMAVTSRERPANRAQAFADLAAFARSGALAGDAPRGEPPWPVWDSLGHGRYAPEEMRRLDRSLRPDVVLVVLETWKGWSSSFLRDEGSWGSATPGLDSALRSGGTIFPWTHSAGFPSVEGGINIHLGIWGHFRKYVINDHVAIRSRSLPEILRESGWRSRILFGYDPSWDNFTPWLERWYDAWEFDGSRQDDSLLADRAIALSDSLAALDDPYLLTLWTCSTHPPYDPPPGQADSGGTDEDKYRRILRWSDRQLVRLVGHLRASGRWDRTVVVIVGDHAQPAPGQGEELGEGGEFHPGYTWTHLGFLGGWPGLPVRGVDSSIASLVDLAPTVLGLLDLRAPNHFIGRDLFRTASRPVLSLRLGAIALQGRDWRLAERVDEPGGQWWAQDPTSKTSWGLLPGTPHPGLGLADPRLPRTASVDPERLRELVLAWGQILDEDRLMPPPAR